jgi:hypothetical protein
MPKGQSKSFLANLRKKHGLGEFRKAKKFHKLRDKERHRLAQSSYGKHYWHDPFYQEFGYLE